jgi:hypothetical protein
MELFAIIAMIEIVLSILMTLNATIMIDMEEVKAQAEELGMTVEEWFREFIGVVDINDCL